MARGEHAGKTSGRWQTRSPAPGVQPWRTPHGWVQLVTNQGTFPLGRGETARAIWRAVAREAGSGGTRSLVEACLYDLTHSPPLDVALTP